MNENNRDVDTLLRRNVDQQLEDFDWEGLRRGIGSRLVRTDAACRILRLSGPWVAVAAAVALTAGLIVLAVICRSGSEAQDVVPGQADVAMIETTHVPGMARVSLLPVEKSGQCEVRILPSDQPRQERGTEASWCIVVGQDSLPERRSGGRDASDVACLF
jgi:hypothetical protein